MQNCLLRAGRTLNLHRIGGLVRRESFGSFGRRNRSPAMWNICLIAMVLCSMWSALMARKMEGHLDLILLVDRSRSIIPADYKKALDFMENLPNRFPMGVDKTQMAIVTFGSSAKRELALTRDVKLFKAAVKIMRANGTGGNTATNDALRSVEDEVLAYDQRPEVPNVLLIITDGCTNPDPDVSSVADARKDAEQRARKMRDEGTEIRLVHVVGDETCLEHERNLVGDPSNVVQVDKFDQLTDELLDEFFEPVTTSSIQKPKVRETKPTLDDTEKKKTRLGLFVGLGLGLLMFVLLLLVLAVVMTRRYRIRRRQRMEMESKMSMTSMKRDDSKSRAESIVANEPSRKTTPTPKTGTGTGTGTTYRVTASSGRYEENSGPTYVTIRSTQTGPSKPAITATPASTTKMSTVGAAPSTGPKMYKKMIPEQKSVSSSTFDKTEEKRGHPVGTNKPTHYYPSRTVGDADKKRASRTV